jgi:hypothetical protein
MASYRRKRGEERAEFIRIPQAMTIFGMGEEKIRTLAGECDAFLKIDKCVLIDYERLRKYVETFRISGSI